MSTALTNIIFKFKHYDYPLTCVSYSTGGPRFYGILLNCRLSWSEWDFRTLNIYQGLVRAVVQPTLTYDILIKTIILEHPCCWITALKLQDHSIFTPVHLWCFNLLLFKGQLKPMHLPACVESDKVQDLLEMDIFLLPLSFPQNLFSDEKKNKSILQQTAFKRLQFLKTNCTNVTINSLARRIQSNLFIPHQAETFPFTLFTSLFS